MKNSLFIICKFKKENSKLSNQNNFLFDIFIICLILSHFSKSICKFLNFV
jgi:hypothetical protein